MPRTGAVVAVGRLSYGNDWCQRRPGDVSGSVDVKMGSVPAVLVVIGGLPGSGKSTVAGALAERTGTAFVRVDRIEQAIVEWTSLAHPVGPVGYAVAHELAREQLALGLDVIVECVNPVAVTRDAWVVTARECGSAIVEVEIVCSDETEHRRRVETRVSDVGRLVKPTWAEVVSRDYDVWDRDRLVVDSARTTIEEAVSLVAVAASSKRQFD